MIEHPGLIYTFPYQYTPRFPWGTMGTVQVMSCVATEDIPAGVLVQPVPGQSGNGPILVRIARDLSSEVGISVYDPQHFNFDVVYNAGDPIPVMRRGTCFAAFEQLGSDFSPAPLSTVRVLVGAGAGQFTSHSTGMALSRGVFQIASKDYYSNGDGSPAADIPFPSVPPPPGITNTTFGGSVCLVELG